MKITAPDKPLELCVIVPTLNEVDNVARLIERLSAAGEPLGNLAERSAGEREFEGSHERLFHDPL